MEALVASLYADRATTLPELLAQAESLLPDQVVEALVGQAFRSLDPLAQQVMQALAIYTVPVPPVAVDYLLQPRRPAIDSTPVLARLVNMQFVRRDAGRYYLHQVDRDYALSRIPVGQPTDRDADLPPFTQHSLRHRGADYFEQTRTPQESWRSLDDLAPQLAEFELRCQGQDYDTAAQVLLDIDFDYLFLWGHYQLTVDLHQRLQGHLTDPWTDVASKTNLGNCYYSLGQTTTAIDYYQQALTIARDIGDRRGEAIHLGNLGNCYADLGQTATAIDYYQQALTIARDTGDRRVEAAVLNILGEAYRDRKAWEQAARYCRQAIQVADEISLAQVQGEARFGLALTYLFAGNLPAAREAATATRAHLYPPNRAQVPLVLGVVHLRQDAPDAATQAFCEAVTRADELLQQTSGNYAALDTKALALCGLALTEDSGQATEATAVFRAARTITTADGIVGRVLHLFDALAVADRTGILSPVRPAAAGQGC